ncbi:MAG TPA: XRE family transcriptional regulator [Clostridia bacterium]|nr:XRE family transcriptional regulator [Clostridia bacterium]
MLANLAAEMTRNKVSRYDIAKLLGNTYNTVSLKINGHYEFTVAEAQKIQKTFFPHLTMEYLFERQEGAV